MNEIVSCTGAIRKLSNVAFTLVSVVVSIFLVKNNFLEPLVTLSVHIHSPSTFHYNCQFIDINRRVQYFLLATAFSIPESSIL